MIRNHYSPRDREYICEALARVAARSAPILATLGEWAYFALGSQFFLT